MSAWIRVCATLELAPSELKVIDVDGAQVVVLNIDGMYYAVEDVCTHDGGELASGERDGFELICARHGARFDVRTGAATAPAYEPVYKFPLKVEDSAVWVRDDRWD